MTERLRHAGARDEVEDSQARRMNGHVVIDSRTRARGSYADWVGEFARLWERGRPELDRFMLLLSPDVRLVAPGLAPTRGAEAGREAFQETFDVLPDLTAKVHRWSASGDVLFIEMTFRATIGGRLFEWANVDRFLFVDGQAVERVAHFDQLRVRRAFLRSPSGWLQLVRGLWRRR